MVYSESPDHSEGRIINFIEGFDNAQSWAEHYFFQYFDTVPMYAEFSWQHIPIRLIYQSESEYKFHPEEPIFAISNGFDSCLVVAIDGDFNTDALASLKEIDATEYPWSHIIESLIVRNERAIMDRYS